MTRARRLLAPLLIVLAGVLAYHDGLDGAFLFDDRHWILTDPKLRVLWPPWVAMGPSFRPLAFYSFAVNYAVSGYEVWSWHALTIALHLLTALLAFGLIRRALVLPRVGASPAVAEGVAFATALIWVVHPLNSQAVMYMMQRAEVMMTLGYVGVHYGLLRWIEADTPRTRRLWFAGTLALYFFGLGSKEGMASAPVTLYLFDAVVVSGSFRAPWEKRKALYLAMAAPLLLAPLAWLATGSYRITILTPHPDSPTPTGYFWAQARVIAEYLRMLVWPTGLNLDHAWRPEAHGGTGLAFGALAMLWIVTAEGVRRLRPLAFAGAAFFLVLAPTSSIYPLHDFLAEQRMYAASIPCLLVGVLAAARALRGRPPAFAAAAGLGVLAIVASALTAATAARTRDYESRTGMWSDVIRKAPHNGRAHYNLGLLRHEEGDVESALAHFLAAVEINPHDRKAHANAGTLLFEKGEYEQAVEHYRVTVLVNEPVFTSFNNFATALMKVGRHEDAARMFLAALDEIPREPEHADAEPGVQNDLGVCYRRLGDDEMALRHFRRAVELDPSRTKARANVARTLAALGRPADAAEAWLAAIEQAPGDETPRLGLVALCTTTDEPEAVAAVLGRAGGRPAMGDTVETCLTILRSRR